MSEDPPTPTAEMTAESESAIQEDHLEYMQTVHDLYNRVYEIMPDDTASTTQVDTQIDTAQDSVTLTSNSANVTTVVEPSRVCPKGAVYNEGNFHALHQICKSEICDCHNV